MRTDDFMRKAKGISVRRRFQESVDQGLKPAIIFTFLWRD
jgi:hypothetical protein